MQRLTIKLVCAFVIALLWSSGSPLTKREAVAQDHPKFIPLGRIPTLLMPGGDRPPRFRRGSTEIEFYVDPNSLENSINKQLSNACAQGQFNMAGPGYFVRVRTETSQKRLGYANSNFNLKDPKGQGGPDTAYLFERDGTSECRVYAVPTRL